MSCLIVISTYNSKGKLFEICQSNIDFYHSMNEDTRFQLEQNTIIIFLSAIHIDIPSIIRFACHIIPFYDLTNFILDLNYMNEQR